MDQRYIQVEVREGVAAVTLDRPDVLNSFNGAMAAELRTVLERFASDDSVRSVLLGASGRAFCAGQDLADVKPAEGEDRPDLGRIVSDNFNPVIRALRELEKPVVCAVNGVAAGAGANIAFACDFVVAGESASFIQAFAKIGLIPDSGGTFLLPRLAGRARATALFMLGDKLPARQALDWGLIHRVVPDAELADSARALAAQLAGMPTRALGLIKRAIDASASNDLSAQLELEMELQREAGYTDDHAEGVRAFLEKRAPRFTGR